MTNKQWLPHNAKVHIKQKGDLNVEDHNKLLAKLEKLVWTDAEQFLPGDKSFFEEDFDKLGKVSALDQQLWVAEMEASIATIDY